MELDLADSLTSEILEKRSVVGAEGATVRAIVYLACEVVRQEREGVVSVRLLSRSRDDRWQERGRREPGSGAQGLE
jgi:hypothetical protein